MLRHYDLMWNTNALIILNSGFMSLTCVADMVLDHQEASNELDDSVRVRVREALLKRHHHQNEKKKNLIPIVRSITEGARKQSEPHLIGEFDGGCHTQAHPDLCSLHQSRSHVLI